MSFWFRDNEILLKQGILLLTTLSDDLYQLKPKDSASSVGEHFRHIIEHYLLFLEGAGDGYIDYDKRKRDQSLETNRLLTIASLQNLISIFEKNEIPLGAVTISQNYNPEEPKPIVTSSVERELLFLVSHTVHHFAIIAFLLKAFGFTVPQGFGYSPATLYANQFLK